ncbi:hypothetical protein AB4428_11260 [Vibrio lentus]
MLVKPLRLIGMQPKSLIGKYINNRLSCYYPNWNEIELETSVLITIAPYELESIKSALRADFSISVLDGVFDFANSFYHPFFEGKNYKLYFPAINDAVLCFGKKESRYIKSLNDNIMVKTYIPSYIKKTQEKADDFNNENAKYDVMLTTANTAYFNDEEFVKVVRYLNETTKILQSAGYSVCYRIFDQKILESLVFKDVCNITTGSFVDSAKNTKCIFTTPSTLAVESMILGIPTATFIYRNTPLTTQTGWIIYDLASVMDVVESMLSNDNDRLLIQKVLLENYIYSEVNELTEEEIRNLIGNTVTEKKEKYNSFAESVLLSRWNFNIKFFIKRWFYKIKG